MSTEMKVAAGAETALAGGPRMKLAVVVSHPIQYYAPFYRALAADPAIDIRVFFCSRIAVDEVLDPGMGVKISWKTDLLGGYAHEFLPEAPGIKGFRFWEVNNPSVAAHLAAFAPDVILVHGYAQASMMRAMLWGRRHGVPVMTVSDRSLKGLSTPLRRAARAVVLPRLLRLYTAILAIGDSIQEFFETFGVPSEAIFRVPNMLDEGFWRFAARPDEERRIERTRLGLGDELAVLYVGKLIPRKRPQDLLAALSILRDGPATRRRVRVLFAGDGIMRAELEAEAERQGLPASFLGFINIDRLPALYCAADVLAHPAENESYGIIALEASVFGLPLVLSDNVGAIGPTSIAKPGENAFVHPAGDVQGLAAALRVLADDPELCGKMSEASRRFAKDHDGRMAVANTVAAMRYCLARAGKTGRPA